MSSSSATSAPLTPELADLRRQFEAIRADAEALTSGMDDRQFNWRPAPGRWSVSECFHHLVLSGERDLGQINGGIQKGRAEGIVSQGPFRHGGFGNWFVGSVEPPAKIRLKAPKNIAPSSDHKAGNLTQALLAIQDRLIDAVTNANGLDTPRIKVASPVPILKLDLTQRLGLVAAHERRHLYQARQVKNAM
jgi:hypothetical protein